MATGAPPKLVTFDPVDAPLREAFDYYQALPDDVRSAVYLRWFWADPKNWERHNPPKWIHDLEWKEFKYSDAVSRELLNGFVDQSKPGIYFFTVRPKVLLNKMFPHYTFYVGISNEGDSGRTLVDRLADYLPTHISQIKKRKPVHKLLRLYYENAWVYYAYVSQSSSGWWLTGC